MPVSPLYAAFFLSALLTPEVVADGLHPAFAYLDLLSFCSSV